MLVIVMGGCGLAYLGYRVNTATQEVLRQRLGRIVPALLPVRCGGWDERERDIAQGLRVLLRRVDSLRNDSAGRRTYDSLVRARPGLLDSARVVERIYGLRDSLNK